MACNRNARRYKGRYGLVVVAVTTRGGVAFNIAPPKYTVYNARTECYGRVGPADGGRPSSPPPPTLLNRPAAAAVRLEHGSLVNSFGETILYSS